MTPTTREAQRAELHKTILGSRTTCGAPSKTGNSRATSSACCSTGSSPENLIAYLNLNETLERVFKYIGGPAVGTDSEDDLKAVLDDLDINISKLGNSGSRPWARSASTRPTTPLPGLAPCC